MDRFADPRPTTSRLITSGSTHTDWNSANCSPRSHASSVSSTRSATQERRSLEPFKRRSILSDPELESETSKPKEFRTRRKQKPEATPRSFPRDCSLAAAMDSGVLVAVSKDEPMEIKDKSYTKYMCHDDNCPIKGAHWADRLHLDQLAKSRAMVQTLAQKEILDAQTRVTAFTETEAYRKYEADKEFLRGCGSMHYRWGYL